MRNYIGDSLAGLIGDLKEDITTFLTREVELAKKEVSEKLSAYIRNGAKLVVGGFVAYAGLIVFLAGIGLIIGFGFEHLGLNSTLAVFIGLGMVGLFAGGIGAFMVLQGAKVISETSPVPEKTIDAVRQAGGLDRLGTGKTPAMEKSQESPSLNELHESTVGTAERLQEDKEELVYQMSPRRWKERAVRHMKEHPLIWSVAALGAAATLMAETVLLGRKFFASGPKGRVKLLSQGGKGIFKLGSWLGVHFT